MIFIVVNRMGGHSTLLVEMVSTVLSILVCINCKVMQVHEDCPIFVECEIGSQVTKLIKYFNLPSFHP